MYRKLFGLIHAPRRELTHVMGGIGVQKAAANRPLLIRGSRPSTVSVVAVGNPEGNFFRQAASPSTLEDFLGEEHSC